MDQIDPSTLVSSIPVLPAAAFKALELLEPSSTANFKDLEAAVKLDSALTARFLRVANSAMYAQRSQVDTLQKAIALLGFSMAKNLVLLVATSSTFDPASGDPFFTRFWRRSLRAAFYARYLAESTPHREHADRLFTAGILFFMGSIGLHRARPADYARALDGAGEDLAALWEAETRLFGMEHRAVSAKLLSGWNLPPLYVDLAAEYGSTRITSRYKQLILLFSLAEALSRRSVMEPLPADALELAKALLIAPEKLAGLRDAFEKRLAADTFAAQCGFILGKGASLANAV